MTNKEDAVKEIRKDVDLRYVLAVKGAHHKFVRFKKQTEVTLCDHPKDALGFETREGAFRWIEEILLPMDQRDVWVLDKELWEVVERTDSGYEYTPYETMLKRYEGKEFTPENPSVTLKYKVDPTNPAHYQSGNMQAIDVIEDFKLGFDLGNAVKYILRAGKKESEEKDLKKALWYIMHHLGWRPQIHQRMIDQRLTNDKLEALEKYAKVIENAQGYSEFDLKQWAEDLRNTFDL